MKKIISIIAVVAMLASMCTFTAFAQNTRTITLSASAEKANVGDSIEFLATLSTSNAVKAMGTKIAFDPNDLELGISAESAAVLDEYKDFVGTADFPTNDSVTEAILGRKSYVSDTYANTYATYGNKNLGNATIDYEEKDGLGRVAFGYAITSAKNALNKVDNMLVGGAVLKVKTTEQKQTTIKLIETNTTDGSNTKYDSIVNEVVINLNGFGEVVEPTIPTAEDLGLETDASQVAKITENVMTSNGWSINKALVFKSAIFAEADVVEYGTEITCEGRKGVLEIKNDKSGSVADAVKTFYAAVTSIRDINLDRTFTAKAYADVTVDGVTTRIYAETPASAVYGN